ncbi:MAG: hypothetical protein M1821_001649 [Bathelium mastoideum]|nr:MAG: hypothetical protein M1821_001649 [Bathelium mastoideum]
MEYRTLAVVSQTGQTLSFFDVSSGSRTHHLEGLIAEPHELLFDARTQLLYVSHAYKHGWYWEHGDGGQEISVVDCNSKQVVDLINISPTKSPHYLALDEKRGILYASVEDGIDSKPKSGGIIGIDLKTRKIIKKIGSEWASHWFVMTPDGTKAYTCNKEAGFISVIDLLGESMVSKIPITGGCEQPAIQKSGKLAYFPAPSIPVGDVKESIQPSIQVVDTVSDKIIRSIPIGLGAATMHVDSQDRLLIGQYHVGKDSVSFGKVSSSNGTLLVLSSEKDDYQQLAALEVGKVPLTILSSPDGERAFVSNVMSGTVTAVDLTTMTVARTLEVDTVQRVDKKLHQGAHGLALIP